MKIILLFIGHCLGDFLFQTDTIAKEKNSKTAFFLLHCFIYLFCMLPFCSLYGSVPEFLTYAAIIGASHGAIDGLKIVAKHEKSIGLYLADQLLHGLVLIAVAYTMPDANTVGNHIFDILREYIPQIPPEQVCLALLCYLVCTSPAGITVKFVLSKVHLEKKQKDETLEILDNNTPQNSSCEKKLDNGFVIGILERFCILTLAILKQYTAISFVIAAKSLARMKKLEDEDFAEKYLVGTFLSVLIAIGCGCLFALI